MEEARQELLGNIATRASSSDSAPLATSSDAGGEVAGADFEPVPEPDGDDDDDDAGQEADEQAEAVDEGAAPRWLLRKYGSPVVRGHALTDLEFDSLQIVVRDGNAVDFGPCLPRLHTGLAGAAARVSRQSKAH